MKKASDVARKALRKVYGGADVRNGKSIRLIVAAKSQVEAAKMVRCSLSSFRSYWCETGNEEEKRWALANPGIVLVHPDW